MRASTLRRMTEEHRSGNAPDAYDYGETVVIQHAAHTGPSALGEVLDARAGRRPWRLVDMDGGAPPPSLEGVRGVLVLGGPMGVADADAYPWMGRELTFLREAVERDVPVFGICLGCQLLAVALGGEVNRRERPQAGHVPLHRTEAAADDPVFAGWPDGASQLFLHEDSVTRLPGDATVMLEGADGVSAWRAADGTAYGVQFHPEVTGAQIAAWCEREATRAKVEAAGIDHQAFATEAERRDRFTLATGLSLVGRWLDAVVGRGDPDPTRGRRAR